MSKFAEKLKRKWVEKGIKHVEKNKWNCFKYEKLKDEESMKSNHGQNFKIQLMDCPSLWAISLIKKLWDVELMMKKVDYKSYHWKCFMEMARLKNSNLFKNQPFPEKEENQRKRSQRFDKLLSHRHFFIQCQSFNIGKLKGCISDFSIKLLASTMCQ